ncbi:MULTISPECIES: hypothetical protein [unclassified Neptuniibacter]|uniref:hypothetical protein n=1 Tax=unclassified Neptuniibacter TaxID=2630693 RepID=UPI0025F310DC|nr:MULTISPECIES: hypothetical protein [unclassified Neptuniibacter]
MNKSLLTSMLSVILIVTPAMGVYAADKKERVNVRQLVTLQERADHRTSLKNAKSAEERDKIRTEYHLLIQKRADEKGITLPEGYTPE